MLPGRAEPNNSVMCAVAVGVNIPTPSPVINRSSSSPGRSGQEEADDNTCGIDSKDHRDGEGTEP